MEVATLDVPFILDTLSNSKVLGRGKDFDEHERQRNFMRDSLTGESTFIAPWRCKKLIMCTDSGPIDNVPYVSMTRLLARFSIV